MRPGPCHLAATLRKASFARCCCPPRDVSDLCVLRLQPPAFYVPAHQIIYELVLEFADKSKPIDFISLKQALQDRGQLEEIGGAEF